MNPNVQRSPYSRLPRLRIVNTAGTLHPNTPESDLLPTVLHRVSGSDLDRQAAFHVVVDATEPGDAIDKVATMPEEEFAKLQRISE